MAPATGPTADEIARLRRRAATARQRAQWCADRAERQDALAALTSDGQRASHKRLGDMHRKAGARQLMSAEIHELLASRIERWHTRRTEDCEPTLMAAIASRVGAASAVASLGGDVHPAAIVAASDPLAQAAHDLEAVLAEGPVTDASGGTFVAAAGQQLVDRWPRIGPAMTEMGIGAVWAAPLGPVDLGFGALCAYDPATAVQSRSAAATRLMADVLSDVLLGVTRQARPGERLAVLGFIDQRGSQAAVHQAAGMLSVQYGYCADDAADLLAACAFADGRPLPEVARQVIGGEQPFCPDAPGGF